MTDRPPTRYHWLRLRAACHPTEDESRVKDALRFASGLDEPGFTGALQDTPMETHHGLPLHILEATVDRSRAVRDILERLFALDAALPTLRATLDRRVDDDGVLYLRLDKQAAAQGRLELLDGEDAIQIRLKLEVYPATRPAAVSALSALLESGRP